MWDSFWTDVLVAVIAAALTGAIAYVTYKVSFRRVERQAVSALIRQLNERRAFYPVSDPWEVPNARTSDDYERVSASVVSARREIDNTRRSVGQREIEKSLTSMKRACNRYLERSAATPDRYVILLMELRTELAKEIRSMRSVRRGLPEGEPGDGAL
ncbi:hypothetical protein [Herbiconiux sp. A18JL235]|uniref:Uncharacterized protein n=1 Tax=Herbiconiux sp. A18JL235 TaxID=3152363 RepID=A0AB39BE36_9MICO